MRDRKLLYSAFLVTVLSMIIPTQAYATDYIPYLPWGFYSEKPSVCIIRPDMQSETWMIKPITTGILQWKDKLNNYTNSTKWNIDVKVVTGENDNDQTCNSWVKIVPTTSRVGGEYGTSNYALAQTGCDTIYGRHLCEIWVYDYIYAGNAFQETPDSLQLVVGHEFGHVLGLGHRSADSIESFVHVVQSNDIMFYAYGTFHKVTNADLDAILYAYSHGGWDGQHGRLPWFVVWNGTISHTCITTKSIQVCSFSVK